MSYGTEIMSLETLCYRALDKPHHMIFYNKVMEELSFIFENAYIAIKESSIDKIMYIQPEKKFCICCPMICMPSLSYVNPLCWIWDLNLQNLRFRKLCLYLPLPIAYK